MPSDDDANTCPDCSEETRECDCARYDDPDQRLGGHDNPLPEETGYYDD